MFNKLFKEKMCDKELLEKIEIGDSDAFNELYNKYWKLIYRWTCNRVENKETVKDLLQNYWADIWTQPSIIKVDDQKSAKNILLGFISFRILDFFKKKKILELEDIYRMENMESYSYSHVLEDIQIQEIYVIINSMLKKIPPLDRDIYLLREREYRTIKEISRTLSVTEETVRRKLALTNKVLQRRLSEHYLS
ncbi:MAG: sigma-70 family RNA polymerase sigma factor [Tannerellaceae bacterium]|nr:sigma-70 family RNA polymerase sigma factor [Tannerellaceae bacterium]